MKIEKLSPHQEDLIERYFKKFADSVDLKKETEEREQRRKLVADILERSRLENLSEVEFGELISRLWASSIWANKDYLVQKIIADNGIDKIRSGFSDLLYGTDTFEQRFDNFRVKGLGPSSLTEILCLFDPNRFGIWNRRAREALKHLKFDDLPLYKDRISGEEYTKINATLLSIAKKLQDLGLKDVDLLVVDYFLYEIWKALEERESEEEGIEKVEFDHDEVRDYIRDIGMQLGFEADTEKIISPGAKVDVIWQARIANLGLVTYVFEVHKQGSIDSLILNLQKALSNPTVQKIIAVSDKNQIEKIRNETQGLPENFRKALTFWEIFDVIKTYEKLSEAIKSIQRLELVKSQFD